MFIKSMPAALVVLGLLLAGSIDAAPYQELEHREGYVPVYIREGNTPLLDINPKLAEAFNEIDSRNFLEANDIPELLDQKPDLILMTVGNGDAVIIQPADQEVSEADPAQVIAIMPAPMSDIEDESDSRDSVPVYEDESDSSDISDKPEELEASPVKTDSQQLEEADEALTQLVNVLEVEMLKKISEAATDQPIVLEEKNNEPEPEAEPQQQPEEEVKLVELAAEQETVADASNDDNKPAEPATDVSTVDAFKTKEIDVKSIETEKLNVPEENTAPLPVSKDE